VAFSKLFTIPNKSAKAATIKCLLCQPVAKPRAAVAGPHCMLPIKKNDITATAVSRATYDNTDNNHSVFRLASVGWIASHDCVTDLNVINAGNAISCRQSRWCAHRPDSLSEWCGVGPVRR
jgi:hypothetical protein